MKIFLFFVTAIYLLIGIANSQTTVNGISANGSTWNITYRDNVTFDDYETAITSNGSTNLAGAATDAPWWGGTTADTASNFATALYNADNNLTNVRFAYKSGSFLNTDIVYYASNSSTDFETSQLEASLSTVIKWDIIDPERKPEIAIKRLSVDIGSCKCYIACICSAFCSNSIIQFTSFIT